MTEQTQLSILPQGEEARKKFEDRLNEIIKLEETITAAKEHIKDYYDAIAEDFVEDNEDVKKADVKSAAKGIVEEHLKAKVTVAVAKGEAILDDYSVIKGKLI